MSWLPSEATHSSVPEGWTAMKMGVSPTGTRARTRMVPRSITEMSWLPVLLTKAKRPEGSATTEKGESPIPSCRVRTILREAVLMKVT